MSPSAIVQKLWNYCNVLRDDGMSYGDYPSARLRAGVEQLTYLLFLKMADERTKPPYNQLSQIPDKYSRPRAYFECWKLIAPNPDYHSLRSALSQMNTIPTDKPPA